MLLRLTIAAVLILINLNSYTQTITTTIILLRHAEKETTGSDPSLSPAGLERSYKLQKTLPGYQPDQFYSTDYTRTKQTLTAWANATGKQIEIYDADQLTAFAEKLKKMQGKTVIVVGHSNTTPQLANLLTGKEKYKQLDDNVYNKIWIITIHNNSITDEVIEY
ncbi:phosphoglycerate mutase family protein [soil metagenome]